MPLVCIIYISISVTAFQEMAFSHQGTILCACGTRVKLGEIGWQKGTGSEGKLKKRGRMGGGHAILGIFPLGHFGHPSVCLFVCLSVDLILFGPVLSNYKS